MSINNKQKGYTLLEVLIALAIFSMMAIITVSGLHTSIQYYQYTQARLMQLIALQKLHALLYQDISQMVDYPTESVKAQVSAQGVELQFIRGGYNTPGNSHLRQVNYIFTQHTLYRKIGMVSSKTESKPHLLLSHINGYQLRFLDNQNHFTSTWPDGANSVLPKAVEVTLSLNKGEISWLFIVSATGIHHATT